MKARDKKIISIFQSLTLEQRINLLKSMSAEEIEAYHLVPEARLFPKQVVPDGKWRYMLFRCGRGFGKSFAGAAWIARKIIDGARSVGLYGENFKEVTQTMARMLIGFFRPGEAYFHAGDNTVRFASWSPFKRAVAYCFTSDKENRGWNGEYLWVDEICNHADRIPEKVKLHYDTLVMAVRVGPNPQILITSTPKPFAWFYEFMKRINAGNARFAVMTGTMYDNPYLGESYRLGVEEEYGGTRFGRQEIYGDLLEAQEGALWGKTLCDKTRHEVLSKFDAIWGWTTPDGVKHNFQRVVVGVDPAVSDSESSDLTGIVVCGITDEGKGLVLDDYSGRFSPLEWAKKVQEAVKDWGADCIVAEKNQGGLLVETNIRTVDRKTRIVLVHAKKSKALRAEPVVSLWEQGRAGLMGSKMVELENEMCTYCPTAKNQKSPDRLDALVYGMTELMLLQNYTTRDLDGLPYT